MELVYPSNLNEWELCHLQFTIRSLHAQQIELQLIAAPMDRSFDVTFLESTFIMIETGA